MGRNSFSKNGEEKLCTGPLHRSGVYLPLNRFYARDDGTFISQCVECRNSYLGRDTDAGLIPIEAAQPMFDRLFEIAGGKTKAAEMLGLHRGAFSRKRDYVRKKTFLQARELVQELDGIFRHNTGEAEIVLAEPLGTILRAWRDKWKKDRPQHSQRRGSNQSFDFDYQFVSPANYIAEYTGIHVDVIYRLMNSSQPRVPLSMADKVLTVIGEHGRLGEDIRVIPNPNWSMEKWYNYMGERGCV